jgi:hypothetical protein
VADLDQVPVSTNGSTPHVDDREAALDSLRTKPENVHLFRGYGPLIAGAILFILMVMLAPTVAPEHVVEQPVNDSATTTTTIEVTP